MPKKGASTSELSGWGRPAIAALAGRNPPEIKGEQAPMPDDNETEQQYALRLKEMGAQNNNIAFSIGRSERAVTAKFSALREKDKKKQTTKKTTSKKSSSKKVEKKPHDLVLASLVEAGTISPEQLIDAVIGIDKADGTLLILKDSLTAGDLAKAIIRQGLSEAIITQLLAR